jgi:hypothetical protein
MFACCGKASGPAMTAHPSREKVGRARSIIRAAWALQLALLPETAMSESKAVPGPGVDGDAEDDQELILDSDGERIDSAYINRATKDALENPPPAPDE